MQSRYLLLVLVVLVTIGTLLLQFRLKLAYTENIVRFFELTGIRISTVPMLGYLLFITYLALIFGLLLLDDRGWGSLILALMMLVLLRYDGWIVPLDPSFIGLVLILGEALVARILEKYELAVRIRYLLLLTAAVCGILSYLFWPVLAPLSLGLLGFLVASEDKRLRRIILAAIIGAIILLSLTVFNESLIVKSAVALIASASCLLPLLSTRRLTLRLELLAEFLLLALIVLIIKSYLMDLPLADRNILIIISIISAILMLQENNKLNLRVYSWILLISITSLVYQKLIAPIILLLPLLVPRFASIKTKLELLSYIGYGFALVGLVVVLLMSKGVTNFVLAEAQLVLPGNVTTVCASPGVCANLRFYSPSIHCHPIEYWKYSPVNLTKCKTIVIRATDLKLKIYDVAIPLKSYDNATIYLLVKSKLYLLWNKTTDNLYYTNLASSRPVPCAVIDGKVIQTGSSPVCFVKIPGAILVLDSNALENPYVQILLGLKYFNYTILYRSYPDPYALVENSSNVSRWYAVVAF